MMAAYGNSIEDSSDIPGYDEPTLRDSSAIPGYDKPTMQGRGMPGRGGQMMPGRGGRGGRMSGLGGRGGMMPGRGQEMYGRGRMSGRGQAMYGGGRMPGRGQGMYGGGRMSGRGQMMPGRGQEMYGGGRMSGRGQMMPGRGQGMYGGGRMPGRGQMMPGRGQAMYGGGRMPGRGQMMPGRGQAMYGGGRMSGRGGGGRMMPGRGGGRGRGGRSMPGRNGGFMPYQPRIPSTLDVFNRYIGFTISSFCSRDEQEFLGFAFPQFTPQQLDPQQQKMRAMKKMFDTKMEAHYPYGIEDGDLSRLADIKQYGDLDSEEEKKSGDQDESLENYDEKNGNLNYPTMAQETEMDPEKKKEMMKKREEMMRSNMTDCHTLLAQLNTKRLYRRIKYFKKKDPNYNVDKAYPFNKDTVEISNVEWQALLNDYEKRYNEMEKKRARDAAERAEKKERKRLNARKSKKKKKKGKGKRGKNANRAAQYLQVEEKEGTDEESVQEEQVDDASVSDESDSDSDDDYADSISDSDDESSEDEDEEFEYVGDKPSKYELLMFTSCPRAVAVLASYPRSGNSLMRNLYEKITLRVTGSDMMGGLQKHDLVGEMATGANNVQFVKTHFPERMGQPPFLVSRAVLLVRNPYDAMDSYFNLMSTNTHDTSLSAEARKKFANLFADMAKKEVLVWRDFHEYWLKQKIPLLVVRYEDLIRDTVKVVGLVIKFVLEISSMTFFEDRINRAIGEEQVEKLGPYKARSGGVGKSLTKGIYTPQLLNQINYGIASTMEKFGYKEMLVPKPSDWKLRPLDQWGVFIPGTNEKPMMINQTGLVRGPNRQTNWRMVKTMMDNFKKESTETPKQVNLL